jgi:hypothetical protein
MKRLTPILLILAVFLFSAKDGWSLPPCPGYYSRDTWTNCTGTHTFVSGDIYAGEWKNGEWHGKGTYTWANGNKYVGEWRHDKKHGQGTYTWTNGSKYIGKL